MTKTDGRTTDQPLCVLGSGKPLFRSKVDSSGIRLLKTKSFDRGTVLLAYKAAGKDR